MTHSEETESPQPGAPTSSRQFSDGVERIWMEIKQISKQVELETRRSGLSARLRLEIRRLRKEETEVRARLGKAVEQAHRDHGPDIALSEVEGFAGGIAALESLREQIAAKEEKIESLRHRPEADQPLEGSEEVA